MVRAEEEEKTMNIKSWLKTFVFGEEDKLDSYIEVSHPDIEVKVKISEGSSPEEIKDIVSKAIDLSLSREAVLK